MRDNQTTTQTAPLESKPYPVVNHWVKREAITESIVYGTQVVALCGERYVVSGQGGGEVKSSTGVVCPLCGSIYDTLKPGGTR